MSKDERFSTLELPDIRYKFQVSQDGLEYFIYSFGGVRFKPITRNEHGQIRIIMEKTAEAYNHDDFQAVKLLTSELMTYWRKYFGKEETIH